MSSLALIILGLIFLLVATFVPAPGARVCNGVGTALVVIGLVILLLHLLGVVVI
jgi:membrane-bound ClpP family serine protease